MIGILLIVGTYLLVNVLFMDALTPESIRHEEILDATTSRDSRLAHSLMQEHVSYVSCRTLS